MSEKKEFLRNKGQELKKLRIEKNLSKYKVCIDNDIQITHYTKLENGETQCGIFYYDKLIKYFKNYGK